MATATEIAAALNNHAATIRRLEDQIRAMDAILKSGQAPASAETFLGSALPAIPGSIWAFFAKLAWANRDLVYAHAMRFEAEITGAADATGTPIDGVAVTPSQFEVVSDSWFFVARLYVDVEIDPSNVLEQNSPQYVKFNLSDDSRQNALYARDPLSMNDFAPTLYRAANPLVFTEYPMAWRPQAKISATFYPMAGFPVAMASSTRAVTTRTARVIMEGVNVQKEVVTRIIDQNDDFLKRINLIGGMPRRR